MLESSQESTDASSEAPRPSYWATDGSDPETRWATRFMRRKVEHLLRHCAEHPGGCAQREGLSHARVLRVERIENGALWRRYARRRDRLAREGEGLGIGSAESCELRAEQKAERSRPIRCDVSDHECYLFHGTSEEKMQAIAKEGFKPELSKEKSRYGRGTYFSDTSCKIHQYTQPTADEATGDDEFKVHVMLYCRVALGAALPYAPTEADAKANFLAGMIKPEPGDPVFDAKISGAHHRRWDSVDVQENSAVQLHRELVVFDADQIYPEFAVYYRTDTAEQEVDDLVRSSLELIKSRDELSQALQRSRQHAEDEDEEARKRMQMTSQLDAVLPELNAEDSVEALERLANGDELDTDTLITLYTFVARTAYLPQMTMQVPDRKRRRLVASYVATQQIEDDSRNAWNKLRRARLLAGAHADALLGQLRPGSSCDSLMKEVG